MDTIRTSAVNLSKRMGSWSLFFDPKYFNLPINGGQLYHRMRSNLALFYPNYVVISICLLAYCLISSPLLLFGSVVLGVLIYSVLSRNQDVELFGQNFTPNQQLIGLSVCAIPLFLLLGFTGVFFWVIYIFSFSFFFILSCYVVVLSARIDLAPI